MATLPTRTIPSELLSRDTRLLELPYSEVCMHMGVAGKQMWATKEFDAPMVQLWNDDGTRFSFPITTGEAGWHD